MPRKSKGALFLENLSNNVFVRLMRSLIHGVGVFAIRDIPAGIDPFISLQPPYNSIKINKAELEQTNPNLAKYVKDMCVCEGDIYWVPEWGMNCIDPSFFLNHSKIPNIGTKDGGENFIALREIKEGEELTIDYSTYSEEDDPKLR